MSFSTLSEWLAFISSIHTTEMDLSLERVTQVAERLSLLSPSCPVIMVGGTNGKGSTVRGLESIYTAAGYKVGVFTSPFLFRFNEQIRIQEQEAKDDEICSAFAEINESRGAITLTPFEFHTLAALAIFKRHNLDLWVLEVGLGGRLDAVNIIGADVAIVTTVAIDHTDYLGDDREDIGWEKAGIFQANKPAICGDFNPPNALIAYAKKIGAQSFYQGTDFRYVEGTSNWSWQWQDKIYNDLPLAMLATQNMSTVLMAVTLLQQQLTVPRKALNHGLAKAILTGRQEVLTGPITQIYDVSHNPASVAFLAKRLSQLPCSGKTYAVFSMLNDKDIESSLQEIKDSIEHWYIGPIVNKRGASLEVLRTIFQKVEIGAADFFPTLPAAHQAVLQVAKPGDRVVVFGSFHTVSELKLAFPPP